MVIEYSVATGIAHDTESKEPMVSLVMPVGPIAVTWGYAQDLALAIWDQAERVRIMRGEKP